MASTVKDSLAGRGRGADPNMSHKSDLRKLHSFSFKHTKPRTLCFSASYDKRAANSQVLRQKCMLKEPTLRNKKLWACGNTKISTTGRLGDDQGTRPRCWWRSRAEPDFHKRLPPALAQAFVGRKDTI